MARTQQPFYVDDASPAIIYTPFSDTLTVVNAIAGWNPYYNGTGYIGAIGGIGNGSSFHITSRDDATLTITWKGTGIDLIGDKQGDADYRVTLDGEPLQSNSDPSRSLLASYNSLQDTTHTIMLHVRIPQDQVPQASRIRFDGASLKISTPSSDYFLQALEHRRISFSENWVPHTDFGKSFNMSTNIGDTARANFSGVAFALVGNTSPNAGNYSVILDGFKSSFSAQSSVSVPGATLFFATGLDETKMHNVQIVNEDGRELSLAANGFTVYAPGPAPASSSSASRSKGTIAALVLAGLLGFFIICGSLFFMCIIRPRRIREKRARRRRHMMRKAQARASFPPAPSVVFPDELDMDSEQASPGHHIQRSSGLSGFARWKKDVENFGGLGLGITFRHSNSTGKRVAATRRSNREEQSFSPISSILTFSSRLSSMRRKGKTKARSKSSSSPSVPIELPNRPESSLASLKEKEKEALHIHPFADSHSITSELSSLSYMHTPSAPVAPPSYALSHDHSDSHSLATSISAIRFLSNPTPSLPSNNQKSTALSGNPTESFPGPSQNVAAPHEPEPIPSLMSDPGHISTFPPRDRGSVQYSSDETASYLGSAAARLAIRELSPRTSEFKQRPLPVVPVTLRKEASGVARPGIMDDQPGGSQHPPPAQKTVVEDSDSSFLHIVSPPNQPNDLLSTPGNETIKGIPNDLPPDMRPLSEYAFQKQMHQHIGEAGENKSPSPNRSPKSQERSPKKKPVSRHFLSIFRLNGHPTSFIDFTSSSSSDVSNNSQPGPSVQMGQRHKSHARWSSSQATQHTHSGSSGMSVTSPTAGGHSYFPYPVALPPSPHHPEGHISSSAPRSRLARIDPQQVDRRPGIRLSSFISPTESVPMSVTENEMSRVSLSGDPHNTSSSSHLPPHPPLPEIHKSNSTLT